MKLHVLLLASVMFVVATTDSGANGHKESDHAAIEAAYRAYVQDFIEGAFEGIADCFRLPAVFEGDTARIFRTRNDVMQFYQDAKANIQEGYSHSVVDSVEIRRVTERIYSADVVYRRLDAEGVVIHHGRTVYLYRHTDAGWKIVLLSPYSNRSDQ